VDFCFTDVESSDEVVNMLMHLDGLHSNVSTASTAEQPNTQDCQPEGLSAVLHDLYYCNISVAFLQKLLKFDSVCSSYS